MYSYKPIVTRVCKQCRGPFQSQVRVEFYCDHCKPLVKKAAIARSTERRASKARKIRTAK